MVDVRDKSFELGGLEFGDDHRHEVVVTKFTPGSPSNRSQTVENPRADSRWFGRDRKTPGTWGFSMFVNRADEVEALDTLAALKEVWDAEDVRLTPGVVMPLRYTLAGRTRRVYGRPVRCEEVVDVRMWQGFLGVEADFELADTLHYADEETSTTLNIVPATTGGLVAPLVEPLRTLSSPEVSRQGQIVVGGNTATWAKVLISGASGATGLRVVVDETWSVGISGTVGHDETITFDGHPWARTILSSNGGSASGRAHPATRLERMRLAPGPHEIRFEGTDPTGTASATVVWRDASRSL